VGAGDPGRQGALVAKSRNQPSILREAAQAAFNETLRQIAVISMAVRFELRVCLAWSSAAP
jgi:hypothetical protein